jgi:hypothetical protein
VAAVAVSDDLGNDGGSRWQMMAGDNVGDDVGNDMGDGDNGCNNAGNDTNKGDGRDTGREGGGATGGECSSFGGSSSRGGDGGGGGLLFIVKIFLLVFLGFGKVIPPLTLSLCLRHVGVLLGGVGNCPQKCGM